MVATLFPTGAVVLQFWFCYFVP